MTISSDVTTVNACENKSDWTGVNHSNPDDNTSGSATPIFREGTQCMQATAGSSTDGFWHEDTAFDLTGEVLVFWVWFSGPFETGNIGDTSIIIADGAGISGTIGRWNFLAKVNDLSVGGWIPVVVWPTQPDEGSAPTVNSIDSVGLEVNNTAGTDIKLVGWDYIHRMSKIIVTAQTVTMEQIAVQDVTDDLGVFTGSTPNFKCQVNLELGAAASTTTWNEISKALNFAAANRDHDIGFIFVDGTTGGTNFTCGEFVGGEPLNGGTYTWTSDDTVRASGGEIFTNPSNCDIFRLFATTFLTIAPDGLQGHDVELPAFISNEGALEVAIVAGGTGYAVNDVLTGVSGTGTKATATVTAVSAGVITALSPTAEGDYTVAPDDTDTTTVAPAGGSGATVSWTMVNKKTCEGNTFNNMGEIDIGDAIFEDNIILGAVSGVRYAGTGTRRSVDNNYIGCGDAVHFDTAQTITMDGDTFSGNGFDIHFSGTGTLTINAVNGANPTTTRVSGGGTVVINNSVTLTLTGIPGTGAGGGSEAFDSEVRVYRTGTVTEEGGIENNSDGTFDYTFNSPPGFNVDIVILNQDFEWFKITNLVLPTVGTSIPVVLRRDRNFDNPP